MRLSNSIELTAVLEEVLSAVTGLQGTERGVLMLYDRERDEMGTAASVGFDPEQLEDVERTTPGMQLSGTVTAVISGGIVVADVRSGPILAPQLSAALQAGCRAVCSTPLLTCGGELVGVIATYFPEPYRPSEPETRLVELYARQAAEFIDNARLYREIRETDRRKGVFLAMLGHELRNPLAAILNALHLMRLPNIDQAGIDQARGIAEQQARHLARLVDDLLDVSRINSGKIELRKGRVRPARGGLPRRRDGPAPDREPPPFALGHRPGRPAAPGCRLGAAGAGPVEPAEQRREVHGTGRTDLTDGRTRRG